MLDMLRVDLIPNVILPACVIHNVSMGEEEQEEAYNAVDCPEEEQQEEVLVDSDEDRAEVPVEPQDVRDGNGALKRDAMVERSWAYRRGRREWGAGECCL